MAVSITAKIFARSPALLRSSVAVIETPFAANAELNAFCAWLAVKNCDGLVPLEWARVWNTFENTLARVFMLKSM